MPSIKSAISEYVKKSVEYVKSVPVCMSARQTASRSEMNTLPSPMKAAWSAEVAGLSVIKKLWSGLCPELVSEYATCMDRTGSG
jgi:hypothetical protein